MRWVNEWKILIYLEYEPYGRTYNDHNSTFYTSLHIAVKAP